jgi:hypothetical protein
MQIIGLNNVTGEQLKFELQTGGRFVVFEYCISILIMTLKRPSSVYFLRSGESGFNRSIPWSLCSLLLGWWGIPWGPIWTVSSVVRNCRGGRDVTGAVVRSLTERGPGPARR